MTRNNLLLSLLPDPGSTIYKTEFTRNLSPMNKLLLYLIISKLRNLMFKKECNDDMVAQVLRLDYNDILITSNTELESFIDKLYPIMLDAALNAGMPFLDICDIFPVLLYDIIHLLLPNTPIQLVRGAFKDSPEHLYTMVLLDKTFIIDTSLVMYHSYTYLKLYLDIMQRTEIPMLALDADEISFTTYWNSGILTTRDLVAICRLPNGSFMVNNKETGRYHIQDIITDTDEYYNLMS